MLSDTFDQKQFEEDLGAAIDEFNEGRSGAFEANSSYDEQAGKFTVEKARSNEKLNREHVIKYAELELASLAETVDLSKLGNDAYEPLNGTLTDDQIQAACDAANNFLGVNVTLKLNGEDAGKALKAFRKNLPVVRSTLDHRSAIGAFALVKRAMLNGTLLQRLLES